MALLHAQGQLYTFEGPVSPNCFMKTIKDKVVLVQMKRDWNYDWMVFDSSLHLLHRNTINTFRGPGLLRSNFVSADDKIIYIEQVTSLEAMNITLTSYDEYGNVFSPAKTIRVEESSMQRIRRAGQSYTMLQSPDKKLVLLTRAGYTTTGLNISCILLDKNLQVIRQVSQAFDMDQELEDLEVLQPGNNGSLYFLKTDKFYNYRLSSKVNLYALEPSGQKLNEKEIFLSKRKIRSINTVDNGQTILLTALSSSNDEMLSVNAYVSIEFSKDFTTPAITREYFFKNNIGKELTNLIPGVSRHAALNRIEIVNSESTEKVLVHRPYSDLFTEGDLSTAVPIIIRG